MDVVFIKHLNAAQLFSIASYTNEMKMYVNRRYIWINICTHEDYRYLTTNKSLLMFTHLIPFNGVPL